MVLFATVNIYGKIFSGCGLTMFGANLAFSRLWIVRELAKQAQELLINVINPLHKLKQIHSIGKNFWKISCSTCLKEIPPETFIPFPGSGKNPFHFCDSEIHSSLGTGKWMCLYLRFHFSNFCQCPRCVEAILTTFSGGYSN